MPDPVHLYTIPPLLRKDGKPRRRQPFVRIGYNGMIYLFRRGNPIPMPESARDVLLEAGIPHIYERLDPDNII